MQTNLDGHVPTISARAQSWLAGAAKKMLIDGKWVAAASGETFDTVDPGNGSVLERVAGFVEASIGEGACIMAGGTPAKADGLFFPPTVVTNTHPGMQIVREEVFGPVVVIDKFQDSPAVLRAANDSPFGLAASLWTQDLSEAHRLAADLQAGSVWVNCHNYWDPALPFGGYKQSGWGRESSALAVQNYLETKSVCMVI